MSEQRTKLDIATVREQLNNLTFRNGLRQVLVGRVSERFEPLELSEDAENDEEEITTQRELAIAEYLAGLRDELSRHNFELARGDDDADCLYAVQRLRRNLSVDLSWLGEGMAKAYSIMAAALTVVLPIVVGMWFDSQFGLRWAGLIGIGIGLLVGVVLLTRFTHSKRP